MLYQFICQDPEIPGGMMWGKNKRKKLQDKAMKTAHFDTLVSSKTHIEGDLQFSGGLHIDGLVKGAIRAEEDSEAVVRISDIGEIDGDVIAPHIIVNGTVHGDVYSSKHIELAENASIKGNVYYHLIEMAMGAEVNGSLVHHKEPVSISQRDDVADSPAEQVSLKAIKKDQANPVSKPAQSDKEDPEVAKGRMANASNGASGTNS